MKREILINQSIGETRIAILEDGKLVELFVERPENERTVGDIYLGKVVNVVQGMRAAFVDIGQEQDAFLHFSDVGETVLEYGSMVEVEPDDESTVARRNSRGPLIREGQEILVQITKEPISTKGSRVTTEISLPGRFLVLMPNSHLIGVSKKIESVQERRRLKKVARAIRPEGFGLIVRTVAEGKDEETLRADFESLMKTWEKIERKARKEKPPVRIHKEVGLTSSVIRDLFTNDVTRLVVDARKLYREINAYLKDVAPHLMNRVEFYRDAKPIFDAYGIETEIERSLTRKIWLRSGGYIIFDHTEAMVVIDVNSGKFIGRRDHEQNALRINLEAAHEIARQLRLRDIGGLIVIDFIDMTDERNRKRLYDEFRRELHRDRAQVSVVPMSQFGLVEMTRERVRPSLIYSFSEPCPTCDATGRVVSKNTVVTKIERWIKRFKTTSKEKFIELHLNPEMQLYLTKGWRSLLRRLMWRYWIKIDVVRDETLRLDDFRVISKKTQEDITEHFKS